MGGRAPYHQKVLEILIYSWLSLYKTDYWKRSDESEYDRNTTRAQTPISWVWLTTILLQESDMLIFRIWTTVHILRCISAFCMIPHDESSSISLLFLLSIRFDYIEERIKWTEIWFPGVDVWIFFDFLWILGFFKSSPTTQGEAKYLRWYDGKRWPSHMRKNRISKSSRLARWELANSAFSLHLCEKPELW